jgi:hypothetical protein
MTWRPHPLPPVPEATAAVVNAAFPKGNLYVDLRTEFGTLYDDALFADLYSSRGCPVEVAPWRLALVTVMQYIEAHVQGVMAAYGEFHCNNSSIKGIGTMNSCRPADR